MENRFLLIIAFLLFSIESIASECSSKGVTLQVLGSGGPELYQKRASTSYLIWLDGKAKVLIDIGGGSALRFGESGASVDDLDMILLSHLHADHTSDLPALIKSSYFGLRKRPLPIYGPKGNKQFPNTKQFIQNLFGTVGAYRYLSDYVHPNEDSYWLNAVDIQGGNSVKEVLINKDIVVSAIDVQHGDVPALAWRIDIMGKSIVFSGDTNGDNGNLEKLAKHADLFVAHNAIPESMTGAARRLHMPPSVIGKVAGTSQVTRLLLSHRMIRTLGKEQQTVEEIKKYFTGPISFANDLDCYQF